MSASYFWRPVSPPPPPGSEFAVELADMLTRWLFGGGDEDRGLLQGVTLDRDAMGWLYGVCSATNSDKVLADAKSLIDAIRQYSAVDLYVDR